MIITVQGTHGSGKSTIVRKVMDRFPLREEIYRVPRKRPIGYVLTHPNGHAPLFVAGHYDTDCGGCDTIVDGVDGIFKLICEYADTGHNILYEGIVAQHYALKKFLNFSMSYPTIVLTLSTPFEDCVADTVLRRGNSGKETTDERIDKLIQTIDIENIKVNRKFKYFTEAKLDVRRVTRDEAVAICLEKFL